MYFDNIGAIVPSNQTGPKMRYQVKENIHTDGMKADDKMTLLTRTSS